MSSILTRKQISDYAAIASIPGDIFEKRLADAKGASIRKVRRITSTQSLVKLACELGTTNRKAPMRDRCPLDEARRMVARLSHVERVELARYLAQLIREGDRPCSTS